MDIRLQAIIGMTAGLLCASTVFGQKAERKHIREGNKLYENEKFTEAEIAYRKSVDVNPRSVEGAYDLGNALYRQQKYPEAAEQYQLVAKQRERLLNENRANAARLSQVYHNLGNINMQGKEYAKSIEAYKESLRLNPKDDETRYNLALAQKLLENQQQEQEQDQQQEQEKQEQEQEQKQEQEQQEQKSQEQQQPEEQMSRDNAQQMLDAFLNDEKDTQEKVKKAQAKQQESRRSDKQW
ncbi:MAG: tetratricopeptide repeat protein [Tannerella sp.]|jgi:tetratricopeptide (TPR) repeat protein|nr:tetratricopeptide repeat protein [Tannerella sp.]